MAAVFGDGHDKRFYISKPTPTRQSGRTNEDARILMLFHVGSTRSNLVACGLPRLDPWHGSRVETTLPVTRLPAAGLGRRQRTSELQTERAQWRTMILKQLVRGVSHA